IYVSLLSILALLSMLPFIALQVRSCPPGVPCACIVAFSFSYLLFFLSLAYSGCMARPLRINLKNGWYHVANRGNNRQAIYLDERDRQHFLALLCSEERALRRRHASG